MRSIYVLLIRALRRVARAIGFLRFLERHRHKRLFLYLRSLFAVYDAEDMARLDLPWWTFSATKYLEDFLRERGGETEVFEYGPGASTVWLAKRVRRVVYVEHDERFARTVERLVEGRSNVRGIFARPIQRRREDIICPSGREGYESLDFVDYVAAIRAAGGPFDLIVIDGRARASCLQEATAHLKPDGAILFDNSRRKRYQAAIRESSLSTSRFRGLTPGLPYREETTILTSALDT